MTTLVRSRLTVAWLLTLFSFATYSLAQPITSRGNGREITASGKLTIKGYGWRRFLVIETKKPFRLEFDAEDGGSQITREIAFYLAGRTESVERMRGQEVTVTGALQLNATSPYYWQGTMVQARSVKLASGEVLFPAKARGLNWPWPDGPRSFTVAITMLPDKLLPQYSFIPETSKSLAVPSGFNCGVNGGGDLLNCSCPRGYVGTRTGRVEGGRFIPLNTDEVLQLNIGEDASHPITVAAECTRRGSP